MGTPEVAAAPIGWLAGEEAAFNTAVDAHLMALTRSGALWT